MPILIIAPHVDDELIGCYSVLTDQNRNRPLVVGYGNLSNPGRRSEAAKAAETFGFTFYQERELDSAPWSRVYVPAITDHHIEHKDLNRKWRKVATHFYSVTNIDKGKPLSDNDAAMKKVLLDVTYPSQKELWHNDAKFYLFENIQESDFEVYKTHHFSEVTVRCLDRFSLASLHLKVKNLSDRELIAQVLSVCTEGKVVISYRGKTIEVNQ